MSEEIKRRARQLGISPKALSGEMDATRPSISLLVKLGSIAVHADELLSPHGHAFDKDAIKSILDDSEVKEWLAQMSKAAFLPVKRN